MTGADNIAPAELVADSTSLRDLRLRTYRLERRLSALEARVEVIEAELASRRVVDGRRRRWWSK